MHQLEDLDGHPIIGISLPDLMKVVEPHADPALVLPAVQRNAVWSPGRVVELWDSVLRGMPMGGFLVFKMPIGQLARAAVTDRRDQKLSDEDGRQRYALFDGQQRLKALMLGWPDLGPSRDLCLWVDLGAKPSNGEFVFRVTTAGRPFGYASNNETDLTAEERRAARRHYLAWLGVPAEERDDLPISNLSFFNVELDEPTGLQFSRPPKRPTPWKATPWTIPINGLIAVLRDDPNVTLDDIAHHCVCRYEPEASAPDAHTQDRGKAELRLEAFRTALARTLSKQDGYHIPLQRVPAHLLPQPNDEAAGSSASDDAVEALTTLFRRIGQNGVRLSDGDLAFSLIKQRYPHTHDAVRDIWFEPASAGEPPVGTLLDQTDIVLLSFQIARALAHREIQSGRQGGDKTPMPVGKPSATDIQRMVDALGRKGGREGEKARAEADLAHGTERYFLELIPAPDQDHGRAIGGMLRELVQLLSYRGDVSSQKQLDDPGLPRPCLAALDFHLISVLMTWLVQLGQDSAALDRASIVEASREELLRFTLWWRLAVDEPAPVAEEALRRLLTGDNRNAPAQIRIAAQFPSVRLYQGLTERFADSFEALGLPPSNMLTYPMANAGASEKITWFLRSDADRFGDRSKLESSIKVKIEQAHGHEMNTSWRLWLPLHYREIAARFWWSAHKRPDLLLWLQRVYVKETFGDYDPLALRENDKPFDLDHVNPKASVEHWGDTKFASIKDEITRKAFRDHRNSLIEALGNYRVIEFGRNRSDGKKSILAKLFVDQQPNSQDWGRFALSEAHAALWRDASGEGTDWPVQRIAAFQAAVEARTEDLYGRFWREVGFDKWHTAAPQDIPLPTKISNVPVGGVPSSVATDR